jgi:hypothetical protein
MTFLCIYVLYSELIPPLHFSPFYLSPVLMVISTGLNILCSFLYKKYIIHIQCSLGTSQMLIQLCSILTGRDQICSLTRRRAMAKGSTD